MSDPVATVLAASAAAEVVASAAAIAAVRAKEAAAQATHSAAEAASTAAEAAARAAAAAAAVVAAAAAAATMAAAPAQGQATAVQMANPTLYSLELLLNIKTDMGKLTAGQEATHGLLQVQIEDANIVRGRVDGLEKVNERQKGMIKVAAAAGTLLVSAGTWAATHFWPHA